MDGRYFPIELRSNGEASIAVGLVTCSVCADKLVSPRFRGGNLWIPGSFVGLLGDVLTGACGGATLLRTQYTSGFNMPHGLCFTLFAGLEG